MPAVTGYWTQAASVPGRCANHYTLLHYWCLCKVCIWDHAHRGKRRINFGSHGLSSHV